MQPQGTLQLISNLLDWGDDVQTAIDEPRFCIRGEVGAAGEEGADVAFEEGISHTVAANLVETRGHARCEILSGYRRSLFGRAQIIATVRGGEEEEGEKMLVGGSDGRCDGCCLGY